MLTSFQVLAKPLSEYEYPGYRLDSVNQRFDPTPGKQYTVAAIRGNLSQVTAKNEGEVRFELTPVRGGIVELLPGDLFLLINKGGVPMWWPAVLCVVV